MPGEPGPGRIGGLGAGAILYGFYIVWIGGDFLSGRFWTAPVLVSIVVCATSVRPFVSWLGQRPTPVRVAWMAAAVLFMVTAMAVSAQITETNRALIRTFPAGHLRLTARLDWEITPEGAYLRKLGRDARLRAERTQQSAQVLSVIGLGGVEAGPDVKIIDRYALGDPLLARLPPAHVDQLKVGHLARKLPQGYRHARETGSLVRMDPALAEYYGKLRLIIAGPIWSRERLATIVRFNLGWFDDLLLEYEQRNRNGA
jgi:arabinofuranosyltransferase